MSQPREAFVGLPAPGPNRPEQRVSDLGDGLVLRQATRDDIEALVAFNTSVHADPPDWRPVPWIGHWTRQLMDGSHPRARADDFLVVHDTKRDRIASTLCLLSHRLRYGQVELAAGMPELVGTHPEYRRLGLVARQFEEIHRWSEERGDQLQIIDGIPWYYRRFGYEMAIEQAHHLRVPVADLPEEAGGDAPEGLRVRDARVEDAAFVAELHACAAKTRYRVSCVRDAAFFRWEIGERHPMAAVARHLVIVETEAGEPRAAVAYVPILLEGWVWLPFAELAPGAPLEPVMRTLLRHVRETGLRWQAEGGGPFAGASFGLCPGHPMLSGLAGRDLARKRPFAWYVRVSDLVGFFEILRPELEARLAKSAHAGFSGALRLSWYTGGARLEFETGRLREVGAFRPSTEARGDAAFPDLSFLHLLFGHRSLAQLHAAYPDCMLWNPARVGLLEALFPHQPSFLWPTS